MYKSLPSDITKLSTFGLQSKAKSVFSIDNILDLENIILRLDKEKEDFLIIGGGSNSLFAEFVNKVLVVINIGGIYYGKKDDRFFVRVGAGVVWDDLVLDTINQGYSGLELLSGIPGRVGATPIQNVGAYGKEISDCIFEISAFDIEKKEMVLIRPDECNFSYRNSRFKQDWFGRFVIISVSFFLSTEKPSIPEYPGVYEKISKENFLTSAILRDIILDIRWSKLPKPEIIPNVGSFFHNPIVSIDVAKKIQEEYSDAKVFDTDDISMKKVSAGWLIEKSGWKGRDLGRVGMYEKNALVMVNRGGATLKDVIILEDIVKKSVLDKFGIVLTREPSIIQ